MDRDSLLGPCAVLTVAQGLPDEAGLHEAGRHVNAAAVAVHGEARWTETELARMAEAQRWAVGRLEPSLPSPVAGMRNVIDTGR